MLYQRHDIGLATQGTLNLMLAPHQLCNEEVDPIHLGTIQNALDGHIVLLLDSVGVTYLGQQGTVKQFVQHHWFHCQILGLAILEV